MNIDRLTTIALPALLFLLCACSGGRTTNRTGELSYEPRYAQHFAITRAGEHSSVVTVKNPWQGASGVEYNLFLSREGEMPADGFDAVTVSAPVKRVVCMSSSYIAFIDALGGADAVVGVSGLDYVSNETIRRRYAEGEVSDVGFDSYINFELVASLRPDLVLLFGVATDENKLVSKLRELGIASMYIGEYLEQSPLGKAEWIVAFGEMFGRRAESDSIFAAVEKDYLSVSSQASETTEKPTVMLNAPWRDTWFVPGDRNYMVRLINDAGGIYACAGEDDNKSRPLSTETAYVYMSRSDFWLNTGQQSATLDQLRSLNPRFARTPPVTGGRVYNCDLRSTPEGGSDFWESGAVRPDIVLRDLVRILHPELLPDHNLYFYRKVE